MRESIVEVLVKNSIIAPEDVEIYQYGLDLLAKKIIHSLLIVILGFFWGKFTCTIVFLIAYAGIREYSGGYHAKTSKGCLCCTYVVTLFSILLFHLFENVRLLALYIILILCVVFIGYLAPQGTLNRPLDMQEFITYRKKTRKRLVVGSAICLLFFCEKIIINGILCAWIVETIMLLIGRADTRYR